jgi:hypothetical protein
MERKKKKQQGTASTNFLTTTKDEKEMLKEAFPMLSLPNAANTNLLDELEGLMPKWQKDREEKEKVVEKVQILSPTCSYFMKNV